MAKEDYGYYQSFSLNDYKGKNVIIKTEPQFWKYNRFELETYIQEYSQDGTDFEPLQDIGKYKQLPTLVLIQTLIMVQLTI
jgi:hypothetical protein